MKKCAKCGQNKALSDFHKCKPKKDGLQTSCKDCRSKYDKSDWARKNPEKARNHYLVSTYGITLSEYDNMFITQNGRCAVCKTENPGRTQSRRFCVDHNHRTNMIRGLLCHSCNLLLGNAKDNPILLRCAADYLEQ